MLVKSAIDAFSTAGAAKALTTGLVAGSTFKSYEGNRLVLGLTTSGTAATSIDLAVEWSSDESTWYYLTRENWVSGGVVDTATGVYQTPGANGSRDCVIDIHPGVTYRVSAKRTGGDATSALLAVGLVVRV